MIDNPLFIEPFVRHTLNGIFRGSFLFMIATGLTIIFGVLGILNLAHGEFYALGAYLLFSVGGFLAGVVAQPTGPVSTAVFALAMFIAVLISAIIMLPVTAFLETVFVRPIYERDEVYQLVLTYALLLVLWDVKKLIWGSGSKGFSTAYQGVNSIPTTELVGFEYPSYNIFAILVGIGVFLTLVWFFDRTKTGRIVRATAINREAATAMGISSDRVFTLVFALGGFFAGFGGAVVSASASVPTVEMGLAPLILSFVVIVIGGLGSIKGAFVGAMLVGILANWATVVFPPAELAAPFALMILILLVKSEGLFGTWGEIE